MRTYGPPRCPVGVIWIQAPGRAPCGKLFHTSPPSCPLYTCVGWLRQLLCGDGHAEARGKGWHEVFLANGMVVALRASYLGCAANWFVGAYACTRFVTTMMMHWAAL